MDEVKFVVCAIWALLCLFVGFTTVRRTAGEDTDSLFQSLDNVKIYFFTGLFMSVVYFVFSLGLGFAIYYFMRYLSQQGAF